MSKKKKRNKKSVKKEFDEIKSYLSKFGIKNNYKEFRQDYWQEIKDEGIDHDLIMRTCDAFSEVRNDMYFLTENIAQKTLSVDYARIYKAIKNIKELNGFPHKPRNTCELGGGAGIIAMWLAQKNLDSQVTVFDQSKNPLAIGKKWAEDLNILNINFSQSSYQTLSERLRDENFDLIIAINALKLEIPFPTNDFLSTTKNVTISELSPKFVEPIEVFVKTCKNLAKKTGVIYLNLGSADELGILVLLEHLRTHDLGIDWFHTTASKTQKCEGGCNDTGIDEIHLFIRPSLPSVLKSAWEDLRAIMLAAQWVGKSISLSPTDFETYLELLSSGEKILDITAKLPDDSTEKFLIYQKAGMIGFFRISDVFIRNGMIHSAAALIDIVGQIENGINQNQIKIIDEYYHPHLKSIMNFFK